MEDPLDPELRAELEKRAKVQLRARMRALRATVPARLRAERSQNIVRRLEALPEVKNARAVACFFPMIERGEVDLLPWDAALRERGVALYYPFMDPTPSGGYRTGFRRTESLEDLAVRGLSFREPPLDAPVAQRGDIDVVLVPALVVDPRGHRIGYGAGYYDATLGDVAPPALRVVVGYDFQLLAEIPHEPHDVACDVVVTDRRVLRAGQAG